jgi:hypothetical protein
VIGTAASHRRSGWHDDGLCIAHCGADRGGGGPRRDAGDEWLRPVHACEGGALLSPPGVAMTSAGTCRSLRNISHSRASRSLLPRERSVSGRTSNRQSASRFCMCATTRASGSTGRGSYRTVRGPTPMWLFTTIRTLCEHSMESPAAARHLGSFRPPPGGCPTKLDGFVPHPYTQPPAAGAATVARHCPHPRCRSGARGGCH